MNSFIRQIDNKTQMSAADVAYSVTSILENPTVVSLADTYKTL